MNALSFVYVLFVCMRTSTRGKPNAWADEFVMLEWLDQFELDTAPLLLPEKLLGMDNHGAQQTHKFRAEMQLANTVPAYTPPECTDCVSPCDHHVGLDLQNMVGQFFNLDFEANKEIWRTGALTASLRRQKIAQWAAAAWTILREETARLKSCFVSTGFLIALDGSENYLIQIPTIPNYDYTT